MNEQHDQIETLLNRALEFKPEERAAYLAGACGGDNDLREKVETLLRAAAEADGFMQGLTTLEETPLSEGPGTNIGRYKLLQKVGEGGMGVVYMAEQTEPVTRKVALKIIKLGMDTKQVVARFEAERQALAMMDHPNIAKVLDAGATDTGRPYFVMELVRGVPITEYCDKNKLSTQERLNLFIPVCQAIQHAHQKGVIHRDIKPSNVMVTLHDGNAVPKVIDFGIAKATNQKLTEKTLFTNYAQMIGTPAYMSPEQAEMSGLDVDTRTDVYSLGVLLYELLTGTTPFPSKELLSLGYGEMQRIIVEREPPKPSTRLSTMQGEELTVMADKRSTEAVALRKQFQGDLDWIVMKALEKDRSRRYESASTFSQDVERFLNQEPVSAAPPSWSYNTLKFARRHRGVLTAAAAIASLLIVATAVSVRFAIMAGRAERAAFDRLVSEQTALRLAKDAQAEAERQKALAESRMASVFEAQAFRLLKDNELEGAAKAIEEAIVLQPANTNYLDLRDRLLTRQIDALSVRTRVGGISRGDGQFERITQEDADLAIREIEELQRKQIENLRALAAADPERSVMQYRLGMTLLESDANEALKTFRTGLKANPGDRFLALGELRALQALDPVAFVSACESALNAFPEDLGLARVIVATLRRFDAGKAIAGYKTLLQKTGSDIWTYSPTLIESLAALASYGSDDWFGPGSRVVYRSSASSVGASLLPVSMGSGGVKAEVALELATCLLAAGREDEALDYYRQLYQPQQGNQEVVSFSATALAQWHIRHGNYAEAGPYLEALEQLMPTLGRNRTQTAPRSTLMVASKIVANQLDEATQAFLDLLLQAGTVQPLLRSFTRLPGQRSIPSNEDSSRILGSFVSLTNELQESVSSLQGGRLRAELKIGPVIWRHQYSAPGGSWLNSDYDDASWSLSLGNFSEQPRNPQLVARSAYLWDIDAMATTAWPRSVERFQARGKFNVGKWRRGVQLSFNALHSVPLKIYLNGVLAASLGPSPAWRHYEVVPCLAEAQATLRVGENTIAVEAIRDGSNPWFTVQPEFMEQTSSSALKFGAFSSALDQEIEKRFEEEKNRETPRPVQLEVFRMLLANRAISQQDFKKFDQLAVNSGMTPPSIMLVKTEPGFVDLSLFSPKDAGDERIGTIWEIAYGPDGTKRSWTRLVGFGPPANPSPDRDGLDRLRLPTDRFPAGAVLHVRASSEVGRFNRSAFGPEVTFNLPEMTKRTHRLDLSDLFNKDVIATSVDQIADPFDAADARLIVNGFSGRPEAVGLPADGRVGDFQLASADGRNALQFTNAAQPAVVLRVDMDRIYAVRFLAGGGNGDAHARITLVYTDGTEEERSLVVDDWFDDPPEKGFESAMGETMWYANRAVIDGMDRYYDGTFQEAKDAALFECTVPVNSGKHLREIRIHPGPRQITFEREFPSGGRSYQQTLQLGIMNILAVNADQIADAAP